MGIIINIFNSLARALATVLPTSPFREHIEAFANVPYLSYFYWFVPIKACLVIFASWLVAVGLFYVYSIAMRWVKMIGD